MQIEFSMQGLTPEDITLNFDPRSKPSQKPLDQRHTIRCFKHCTDFVFCFELPDCCPVCNTDLLNSSMKMPPFISPSPFEFKLNQVPALLVKPSKGKCFLTDYKNGDDLHCGIIDECGVVHDFDESGLHTSDIWLKAIHIPIQSNSTQRLPISSMLSQVEEEWSLLNPIYNSETSNCFTFALWSLQQMGYYQNYSEKWFLDEVVLPKTTEAARYISMYRQLISSGGTFVSPKS